MILEYNEGDNIFNLIRDYMAHNHLDIEATSEQQFTATMSQTAIDTVNQQALEFMYNDTAYRIEGHPTTDTVDISTFRKVRMPFVGTMEFINNDSLTNTIQIEQL